MALEVLLAQEGDRETIGKLLEQAFNLNPHQLRQVRAVPLDELRVITDQRQVVGTLRVTKIRQWFGGLSLPCGAIAGVAVRPESRGRGIAATLLKETLAELKRGSIWLSALYPSTVGLYRRAGYEYAGPRTRYRVPVSGTPRGESRQATSWDDGRLSSVMACYSKLAIDTNGLIDRSVSWWREHVLEPPADGSLYRYLIEDADRVTGYVLYEYEKPDGPIVTERYGLACRDLVWTDQASASALLAVLGAHGGLGTDITWYGPPEEPMKLFYSAAEVAHDWTLHWMLRLVDVHHALVGRGYPKNLDTAIEMAIDDPILTSNSRAFRLTVKDGHGSFEEVPSATLRIDVGGLAAMFSGWLPARDLARIGRMSGATPSDVEVLESLFGGGRPWMLDLF